MGLFGKKKNEEEKEVKGGGLVESVNQNNTELQDLLKEFREMRSGVGADSHPEEEPETFQEEEIEDGEEYEVSEAESESIEDFLNAGDDIEELIEDEEVLEEDEEVLEDEVVEDEEILEEPVELEEEITEEVLDEQIEDEEILDEEEILEEELEDEEDSVEDDDMVEEPIDVQVNISEIPEETVATEEDDIRYAPTEEPLIQEKEEDVLPVDAVTGEEMDKKFDEKFDEFEKRLMDKLMKQFAAMQVGATQSEPKKKKTEKNETNMLDEDLEIKTVGGKLVINGFKFSGDVVMFTPLESVKKATWEEVVRRKGHCTYHLTTSGNGGWFIKKSNAPNPYAYIEKKEEAEELAKVYAMREKAELKIHNAKGVIEKSLSFGREKLRG